MVRSPVLTGAGLLFGLFFAIRNETIGIDFKIRYFYARSVAEPWFLLNLNAFPASSIDVRQDKLKGGHNSPRIPRDERARIPTIGMPQQRIIAKA
jgi:hypothetical protein